MTADHALVPARGTASGSVLVLPGGGYAVLAPHEAEPYAQWLAGLGLDAHILRYTVGRGAWPAALDQARALLREVRAAATGPVGVIGSSAGGHLAACLSTAVGPGIGGGPAHRPDFAVLAYPVTSFTVAPEPGSTLRVLGPDPSPEARRAVSPDRHVDRATPPTFVWTTADDPVVPAGHSLRYAQALVDAGVPVELHVFPHGRHGLALTGEAPAAATWTDLCERWLRDLGVLDGRSG